MIIVPFCKCIVITREFKKEDGSVCVELCLTFKKGVVIECPHCGHHGFCVEVAAEEAKVTADA